MPTSRDINRSLYLILAIALMFASAICGFLYMDSVSKISGWIGLPLYEGYLPRVRWQADLSFGLAVLFPFFAALLLGFVKDTEPIDSQAGRPTVITDPEVSHELTLATAALKYLIRVAISVLASVALMAVFVLAVLTLKKMGLRAF